MSQENFNFKEFILEKDSFEQKQETATPTRSKTEYIYEIEWQDNNDFIISRRTSKSKKKTYLVVMVSQDQFYIKKPDETIIPLTDDYNTTNETTKLLNNFVKNIPERINLNVNWLESIDSRIVNQSDIGRYSHLTNGFFNPHLMSLIKENVYHAENFFEFRTRTGRNSDFTLPYHSKQLRIMRKLYERCTDLSDKNIRKAITSRFYNTQTVMINGKEIYDIPETYIIDKVFLSELDSWFYENLREYLLENRDNNTINKNLIRFLNDTQENFSLTDPSTYPRTYGHPQVTTAYYMAVIMGEDKFINTVKTLIDNTKDHLFLTRGNSCDVDFRILNTFEFINKLPTDNFIKYLTENQFIQNYGTFGEFMDEWSDSIKMQIQIDGRITEPYPENLRELHNSYSIKTRIMEMFKEANRIRERNDNISKIKQEFDFLESETDTYVFKLPETTQDILDEAAMQHNCLASYIDKHTDRKCILVFMREKEHPDTSLVTIELDPNTFKPIQIKQRYNHEPTTSQKTTIDTWNNKILSTVSNT